MTLADIVLLQEEDEDLTEIDDNWWYLEGYRDYLLGEKKYNGWTNTVLNESFVAAYNMGYEDAKGDKSLPK